MRDFGCTPQPIAAFMLNLGLESLPVRIERHCQNAQAVAEYLEKHPKVSWVNFPGLALLAPARAGGRSTCPEACAAWCPLASGAGGEAAMKFMDSLRLAQIVVHVADARTSVLHPASTTHRQLTDEQLVDAGISADLVRLSVGIENIEDILEDLEQAFDKI